MSQRSPQGIRSPTLSVSRFSTSSMSMIFRAVRSRWSTLETATSVCTSAGLKGYTWRNIVAQGRRGVVGGDALGQVEHEVAAVDLVGEVEQLADEDVG